MYQAFTRCGLKPASSEGETKEERGEAPKGKPNSDNNPNYPVTSSWEEGMRACLPGYLPWLLHEWGLLSAVSASSQSVSTLTL